MTETKKLSRKTRKMLALFEAQVSDARQEIIERAGEYHDETGDVDRLFAAVKRLRNAEALLAAAVEVAHA